jgi:hypothetical protein
MIENLYNRFTRLVKIYLIEANLNIYINKNILN